MENYFDNILEHLYWIGTRQSDISNCLDINFEGSICLFGKHDPAKHIYAYCGNNGHPDRIDHNSIDIPSEKWIFETVKAILRKLPTAKFYCYNPILVFPCEEKKNPYFQLINEDSSDRYIDHFICINDPTLLHNINNKKKFRELMLSDTKEEAGAHFIPAIMLFKKDCQYSTIKTIFEEKGHSISNGTKFVIQAPIASGGASTFIIDDSDESQERIDSALNPECEYICTEFKEHNVPVNVHCIIFEDNILLSAPSIQLLRKSEDCLIYRGADYIECKKIPYDLMNEFYRQAQFVCKRLYFYGFRGICGIDGIITNINQKNRINERKSYDDVFIMEVNPRFQASSDLLNLGMKGLPSLQKLNICAFSGKPISEFDEPICSLFEADHSNIKLLYNGGNYFSNISIPYSSFSYVNNGTTEQAMHLLALKDKKEKHIVAYQLDGLCKDLTNKMLLESKSYKHDAYLYRIIFDTNISWINTESQLYFNENIIDETEDIYRHITKVDDILDKESCMIRLKVALLIQGVIFAKDAQTAIRPGTFSAVDIVFADKGSDKNRFNSFVVNTPIVNPQNADESSEPVKFTELSPFTITCDKKGDLILEYYGKYVDNIFLFPEDQVSGELEGNIPYTDLAYLSTDRLRVHLTNACKFKRKNIGCKFCGIKAGKQENLLAADKATFASENVHHVVEKYVNTYKNQWIKHHGYSYYPALRHFLVGGQTMDINDDGAEERLIDTIHQISSITNGENEIYAMIIPCSMETVQRMKENGLTHLAFNLEIFDDYWAKRFMPGKRANGFGHTTNEYLTFLKDARAIMGKHESVRSMLMIGLEPLENTLTGIRSLLDIDVQPMLSIFRPMPGTPLSDYVSPQISDVVELFEKANTICKNKKYSDNQGNTSIMHLGPDCTPCQNNTVSLPYK